MRYLTTHICVGCCTIIELYTIQTKLPVNEWTLYSQSEETTSTVCKKEQKQREKIMKMWMNVLIGDCLEQIAYKLLCVTWPYSTPLPPPHHQQHPHHHQHHKKDITNRLFSGMHNNIIDRLNNSCTVTGRYRWCLHTEANKRFLLAAHYCHVMSMVHTWVCLIFTLLVKIAKPRCSSIEEPS